MRSVAKLALVALVAVMCMGASAATSASAGEPLFINESKKALLFTADGLGAITLRGKRAGGEATIKCEKSSGHGFALDKSPLARELHIEFSGKCEQESLGSKGSCSEPIKLSLSRGELGVLNGHFLLLLAPETGTRFVNLTCGLGTTEIEGAVIGEFKLNGRDGSSQYNVLRKDFLLLYKAKGTTQEPEEIELLGSLMKGVALKAEGFLAEKMSAEAVQLLLFDGSTAIGEIQGQLRFLQEGVLKIPVGATNIYTVEYTEFKGNSGSLTRTIINGPFTTPGGTCGTTKNNLKNKETCTMEIKCNGVAKEKGEVEVHSSVGTVIDARDGAECT